LLQSYGRIFLESEHLGIKLWGLVCRLWLSLV